MNVRYILPAALLAWGTSAGQWAAPGPMLTIGPDTSHPAEAPAPMDDARDGGDVVYHEDFTNGLQGNTPQGGWSTSGPDGALWLFDLDGPNGDYSSTTQKIAGGTTATGFMIFDSNLSNDGCVPLGTCVDREGALISPVMDLSATPYVELEWRQRLRFCCGGSSPHWVDVSTDGGNTWPTRFAAAPGRAGNADPGTEVRKVNITAAITGNPANVRVRFIHEAGASHYHWQIDDVKLVELYEHDLRIEDAALTSWDPDVAMTYDSIPYTIFPYTQLRPMGLHMDMLNNGSMPQDVVASFLVERDGEVVMEQAHDYPAFPAGASLRVHPSPDFTPPAIAGDHEVTFTVSSEADDQTPTDNVRTLSFQVSEHIYARDNGALTGFFEAGEDGNLIVCNGFYVAETTELHGLQVAIRTGSEVGSVVGGDLRGNGFEDILHYTQEVELEAGMLSGPNQGNFIDLPFLTPVTVNGGQDYIACITGVGTVRIGQSGVSPAQTAFIWYLGSAGLDWYYTTTTPMIRMNFGEITTGIEEAASAANLGQNQPNPADRSTFIDYEVMHAGAVSMVVRDISGKLVMEQAMGVQAPGTYRVELNTAHLPAGVYTYALTTGDVRTTKRMVVMH